MYLATFFEGGDASHYLAMAEFHGDRLTELEDLALKIGNISSKI